MTAYRYRSWSMKMADVGRDGTVSASSAVKRPLMGSCNNTGKVSALTVSAAFVVVFAATPAVAAAADVLLQSCRTSKRADFATKTSWYVNLGMKKGEKKYNQ